MTQFYVPYTAVFVLPHYTEIYGGMLHEKETKTAAWETNSLMMFGFLPHQPKLLEKKKKECVVQQFSE